MRLYEVCTLKRILPTNFIVIKKLCAIRSQKSYTLFTSYAILHRIGCKLKSVKCFLLHYFLLVCFF